MSSVGAKKYRRRVGHAAPGGVTRAPRATASSTSAPTRRTRGALMSGPIATPVRRRAHRQRLDLGAEAGDELVGHVGVHVEPVGRGAGLPAVAELRDHRAGHGRVEVGVGGDDERRVAAELHRGVEHPVGGLVQQQPARRRWTR